MTIYIDSDYKCHTKPGEGLTEVKTNFFDDCMIPEYIEGYRFVPKGKTWVREDGVEFTGEMVTPWQDWQELDKLQAAHEREQYRPLTAQNTELLDAMAAMVEDVYNADVAAIEEG